MAKYIGNIPSVGEFKKLDSLTSTFNGSLTQFDLEYGSTSVSVGDASQLIVSLNGIIQEPLTAYTLAVGGSAIVFSSAPASTDTCHIILLGGVGGTSTVSDGAVTAAKLDAGLKDYLEETYTANGSQTTYALTRAPIGTNDLMITIDGIVQPSTAYSIAGTTLTISPALPNGTDVRVVHMGVRAGFVVPSSSSITAAMFQDFTTDVKFNDNAKAVFGTGDDLQIYHDGSSSYISDVGTGNLRIKSNGVATQILDGSSLNLAVFNSGNGQAQLYNVNGGTSTIRLATTSTGIDVTGGVSIDDDNNFSFGDGTAYIQGSGANDRLKFITNNSEAMRIDSSGNVGIGDNITKTWSLGKALHIGNAENSLWGEGDYAFHLVQNGYYNGGWKYTHSDAATMYSQSDGGQYWYHAGNGTADNALTWTPTMRLDTSGNLLVGRTSNLAGARTLISGTKSGTNGTNGQLVIVDEQGYSTTDNGGGISFAGDFYNGGQVVFATIQGVKANNTDSNDAGALKFTTKVNGANQVEAMRIAGNGNLIVGNAGVSFTSDRLQVKSPVGEPVASFYRPRNTAGGGLVRFMSDVGGTQTIVAQVTSEGNFITNGGINFGGSVNSGGVTSSSNTLDDYEEGTWTPAVYQAGFTFASFTARYTKIGRLVTVTCDGALSGTGNGNDMKISGLPFTSMSNGHSSGAGYTQYYPGAQNGSNAAFIPKSGNNDTFVYFQNGNGARYDGDRFSAGFLNFTITYFTS